MHTTMVFACSLPWRAGGQLGLGMGQAGGFREGASAGGGKGSGAFLRTADCSREADRRTEGDVSKGK